ncbi:MAG TPA: serine protease [Xanthobacteraceae bacterium]|nr:serine protease [Xanthobacteraceae bacterium]
MRLFALVALALVVALPVCAQAPPPTRKPAPPDPVAQSYAAVPLGDRKSIQSDLIWTSDYNGLINGEFGERAISAVKAFQKAQGAKMTGLLNAQQRSALSAAAKSKQDVAGWTTVDDLPSATRLGLPGRMVPQTSPSKAGTRFAAADGEVVIETFRIAEPGATLQSVFEQQKTEPGRQTDYSVLRGDFFVMSGLQGGKKFYIRAQAGIASGNAEVRGILILYDHAMARVMDPITVAMSNAFAAFPLGVAVAAPVRRKVEYATGILVGTSGHVLTDRQATDGCRAITVAGLGPADRIAEEKDSELALLRVFGAGGASPLLLATDEPQNADVTLVGVPDPQQQDGAGAVVAENARLVAAGAARVLDPAPGLGFSGAAVIDGRGRLVGMAELKIPDVAGSSPPASHAVMVTGVSIRDFLDRHHVGWSTATALGVDAARSAVARVICVRK